jgi:hypothetical protein
MPQMRVEDGDQTFVDECSETKTVNRSRFDLTTHNSAGGDDSTRPHRQRGILNFTPGPQE